MKKYSSSRAFATGAYGTVLLLLLVGFQWNSAVSQDHLGAVVAGMTANDSCLTSYQAEVCVETEFRTPLNVFEIGPPLLAPSDQVAQVDETADRSLSVEKYIIKASLPKIHVEHRAAHSYAALEDTSTTGTEIWDGKSLKRITYDGDEPRVFITTQRGPGMGLNPLYSALFPLHKSRAEYFTNRADNKVEWIGIEELDGVQTWVVDRAPTDPKYNGYHVRFWLDPQRGCLPLKEEIYNGSTAPVGARTTFSNLTQFGGVWIPLSLTMESFDLEGNVNSKSTATISDNIVVNGPISEDVFQPTFASGAAFYDEDLGAGWFRDPDITKE